MIGLCRVIRVIRGAAKRRCVERSFLSDSVAAASTLLRSASLLSVDRSGVMEGNWLCISTTRFALQWQGVPGRARQVRVRCERAKQREKVEIAEGQKGCKSGHKLQTRWK